MNLATPVIYEVTLELDPAIAAEFDVWLEAHMRRVLEQEGFESGHVFKDDAAVADGWARRVVHYRVRSGADLARYFEDAAPRLRAEGVERWGERFRASRRVLSPHSELATPSASKGADTVTECPNCGSLNIEKFCAACGQDNRVSVIAFPRLFADFVGDVLNFDSRLFASLWPLLVKPGWLTKEYLAGRRVRFLPPVRMYLFLSLFFFGVIALIAPDEITLADDAQRASERDARRDIEAERAAETGDAASGKQVAGGKGWGVRVNDDGEGRVDLTDDETGWLKVAEDRMQRNVDRMEGPEGKEYRAYLLQKGIGHLPLMMFLLLPIYALMLKVLYVRSGRYYVEHLIYSLHLHAFIFLTLGVLAAWYGIADALGYRLAVPGLVVTLWWWYFGLYPLLAMRRVYGQGWFKTGLKYLLLGMFYWILLAFGLVGAMLLTLST